MSSHLDPQRYHETLDADTERILTLGASAGRAAVPSCPGWSVDDVVDHLAQVYQHKIRVMADNEWPDPWPPTLPADQPPGDRLAEAKAELFTEFAEHQLDDQTTTFSPDDTTIGFWLRRMALEAAVHRYDVELATGQPLPVPDDLALDGIDEVLRVFLGGPWWDSRVTTEHPVDATVAVESGGRRWTCVAVADQVAVSEGTAASATTGAAAVLGGEPSDVYLWLWGRVDDSQIDVTGSPTVLADFRARLVECTG